MTEAAGAIPLPPSHVELLALDGPGNRSLLYDRGFDRYGAGWTVPAGEKQAFLAVFGKAFRAPRGFAQFLERRRRAVAGAEPDSRPGVSTVELVTQTRLVTGLGLPSPTETGLLLDRLTGCPYLPGSSVKGILRNAAKLVARGELETERPEDAAYWQEHRATVFGPDRSEAETPAKGQVLFFDAFPTASPSLEVDVLTPHHSDYYGDESGTVPPADWHDPVPVAFLTVAPGTTFRFHFADAAKVRGAGPPSAPAAPDPLPALERLLRAALDWLGIGGKTSSGYGLFGGEPPPEPRTVRPEGRERFQPGTTGPPPHRPQKRRAEAPPPTKSPGETLWKDVELEIREGKPTVFKGKKTSAQCAKDDLDPKLWQRLKKRKKLRVDVRVVQSLGSWRIDAVEEVHE